MLLYQIDSNSRLNLILLDFTSLVWRLAPVEVCVVEVAVGVIVLSHAHEKLGEAQNMCRLGGEVCSLGAETGVKRAYSLFRTDSLFNSLFGLLVME